MNADHAKRLVYECAVIAGADCDTARECARDMAFAIDGIHFTFSFIPAGGPPSSGLVTALVQRPPDLPMEPWMDSMLSCNAVAMALETMAFAFEGERDVASLSAVLVGNPLNPAMLATAVHGMSAVCQTLACAPKAQAAAPETAA